MHGRTEAAVEIRAKQADANGVRPRALPRLTLLRGPGRPKPRAAEGSAPRAAALHRIETGPREADSCTDGELVTLALNGGAVAFSHLMRRHARHLNGVIARRLRDPEDVRDAVQDTRLAVWRALQHYDAGRPFQAWITTIALNKCRDWARRRTAQLGMLSRLRTDALYEGGNAVEERGIERWLIGRERMRCLGRALEALPPQLRAPLLLTAVSEHSQETTARELGLTRKAVEMRVRRARQQLARALEPERP
ncbi:MAG: RNA polymerase sigma factor [Steroidobacteraceae bacterium]